MEHHTGKASIVHRNCHCFFHSFMTILEIILFIDEMIIKSKNTSRLQQI